MLRIFRSYLTGMLIAAAVFLSAAPVSAEPDPVEKIEPAETVPTPDTEEAAAGRKEVSDRVFVEWNASNTTDWSSEVRSSAYEAAFGYELTDQQAVAIEGQKEMFDPYEERIHGGGFETKDVVALKYELSF